MSILRIESKYNDQYMWNDESISLHYDTFDSLETIKDGKSQRFYKLSFEIKENDTVYGLIYGGDKWMHNVHIIAFDQSLELLLNKASDTLQKFAIKQHSLYSDPLINVNKFINEKSFNIYKYLVINNQLQPIEHIKSTSIQRINYTQNQLLEIYKPQITDLYKHTSQIISGQLGVDQSLANAYTYILHLKTKKAHPDMDEISLARKVTYECGWSYVLQSLVHDINRLM